MQILNNYDNLNNRYTSGQKNIYNFQNNGCRSFTGHTQIESFNKLDIPMLVHQTELGRDLKTKLFVRNYILDKLKHRDKINIVSGGCSTGEEGVTYSMLLQSIRDKVNILGIDLGKNAIKQANSGNFVFEVPKKGVNLLDHFTSINDAPYGDAYLVSQSNKGLSAEQCYLKKLFKEYFSPTGRKIRTPFWEWLHNKMEKKQGYNPLELDRFEYKVSDSVMNNCRFIEGDIREIDKLTKGEKSDVISFNNALYHLTTYTNDAGDRTARFNREEIAENLFDNFKNCLNDDGLVVFGENEGEQILDYELIPKVMKKLDFTPIHKTPKNEFNVWVKNKK